MEQIFLLTLLFYFSISTIMLTNFIYSLIKIHRLLKDVHPTYINMSIIDHYTGWLCFKHWFVKLNLDELKKHSVEYDKFSSINWRVGYHSDEYEKYSDFR